MGLHAGSCDPLLRSLLETRRSVCVLDRSALGTWALHDATYVAIPGAGRAEARDYLLARVRDLPGWETCATLVDFCGDDVIASADVEALAKYAVEYREWELAAGVVS